MFCLSNSWWQTQSVTKTLSLSRSSDDRRSLVLELDSLHGRSFEGICLNWFFIERLQRRLEQIVGVGLEILKLLTHIRSRGPTWIATRGKNLPLVVHKVVMLIFALGNSGIEGCLLASQSFLSNFSL